MLKEGDKAPEFRLKTDESADLALKDLHGKRVVLFFFPKASTPGWTTEASEFRDAKKEFDNRDTVILGMSADSEKALANFKKKQKLNFALLSDPSHKTIEAYGVWRTKKFLGRSYKGIVRSTFLIGRDGALERVWDPVTVKGHAAEVLQVVRNSA